MDFNLLEMFLPKKIKRIKKATELQLTDEEIRAIELSRAKKNKEEMDEAIRDTFEAERQLQKYNAVEEPKRKARELEEMKKRQHYFAYRKTPESYGEEQLRAKLGRELYLEEDLWLKVREMEGFALTMQSRKFFETLTVDGFVDFNVHENYEANFESESRRNVAHLVGYESIYAIELTKILCNNMTQFLDVYTQQVPRKDQDVAFIYRIDEDSCTRLHGELLHARERYLDYGDHGVEGLDSVRIYQPTLANSVVLTRRLTRKMLCECYVLDPQSGYFRRLA